MARRVNRAHLIVHRARGASDFIRTACGLTGTRSSSLPYGEMENFIGDRIYEITESRAEADCKRCLGVAG